MLFRYIGDGNESPITTVAYGVEFRLGGNPQDVTDAFAAKKLLGNRCFVEVVPEEALGEAPSDAGAVDVRKRPGRPRKSDGEGASEG